jgi:carbon-monoxide dehydrogenase medium subunit
MKMAPFELHRPATLDEALALLERYGPDAKVIAGGQSLVPMMAMRLSTPAHLVDITNVTDLSAIRVAEDDWLEIGATVRHSAAEVSSLVRERSPLLAKALPWIGHRAIRNRGTVCGSLAHADPAAELPAVAVALGAELVLQSSRGARQVAATDYFLGYLSTAAADDEVMTAVRLPLATSSGTAVLELSRRHGDFALTGVVCALTFGPDHAIVDAALALFGVADTPVRANDAEASLRGGQPSEAAFTRAADAVMGALHPSADIHASAAYRRHVAGVLTRRALVAAAADAGRRVEVAA